MNVHARPGAGILVAMESRGLVLTASPDHGYEVALPIPELVTIGLPGLVSAQTREWVDVAHDQVTVAGHRFRIIGWVGQAPGMTPGLVCAHQPARCTAKH